MRPMTKSEKFLLGVLGLIVLGAALFYGGRALRQKQAALDLQRASLHADQSDAEFHATLDAAITEIYAASIT